MNAVVLWVGVAVLLLVEAAGAQSAAELARSKNCLNCHDDNKKKVGPAFKDVAARYKDNKDAEATIAGKLKDGKGHPVKVAARDAELKALAAYALSVK